MRDRLIPEGCIPPLVERGDYAGLLLRRAFY